MKQNEVTNKELHQAYVKRLKREKRLVRFWQAAIFVFFFSLWEAASHFRWIDPLLFSSPRKIYNLFIAKVTDGSLWVHLNVTLFETIAGFIIGTFAGILLAAILWWSNRFSKIIDPYLVILNAMPKVALGPIIIVALGPGYISIIAMGAIISIIITTLVVYNAFQEIDSNYIKVLQSLGASKSVCFKEAIFPASFPTMISSLKVNVGLSWVGVIVGEFLVSKQGLGYLIIYGFQVFDFTLVLFALLIIAFFAAIMYQLVEKLEKKLIRQ